MTVRIDELPAEMLMKIFSYLASHKQVVLVNKRFNAMVCKLIPVGLTLHPSLIRPLNKETLQSIRHTNKNVTKIIIWCSTSVHKAIHSKYWKVVFYLVKKFSARIKCLVLREFVIMADFIKILSLVPNTTDLLLTRIFFMDDTTEKTKERCLMDVKEDLNLYHLKKLTIEHCCDTSVTLFNRLPPGVLTEFYSDYDHLNDLKVFFKRQTNITKLAISTNLRRNQNPIFVEADLFNQKLESLEWNGVSNRYADVKTILSSQTNLKSLKLIDGEVDEKIVNVVTNQLTELETLSIQLDANVVDTFENIKKLKNLKELTLPLAEIGGYEVLANFNYSGITTLNLMLRYDFLDDFIARLAKSMTNLRVLLTSCDKYTNRFHESMKYFNFVEVLRVYPSYAKSLNYHGDYATLMSDGYFNPKLIELQNIYFLPYKTVFIEKLINDYPNLKKLAIMPTNRFTLQKVEIILEGFKQIESLSLNGQTLNLTAEVINLLRRHKNHLKYFALLGSELDFTSETMTHLSGIFDVIKNCSDNGLKCAVDAASMKSGDIYQITKF